MVISGNQWQSDAINGPHLRALTEPSTPRTPKHQPQVHTRLEQQLLQPVAVEPTQERRVPETARATLGDDEAVVA